MSLQKIDVEKKIYTLVKFFKIILEKKFLCINQ